jgi:glycosyltransferase involved in cell wall biosynthesis
MNFVMLEPKSTNQRLLISIFLPSLEGGGAEHAMCNLAIGLAGRGLPVDLVLAKKIGPYLRDVPPTVRVIDLASRRLIASAPKLVRYLSRENPRCLISALTHANIVAIISHLLAGSRTKLIVSEQVSFLEAQIHARSLRDRLLPILMRLLYKKADSIVAISRGVADQVAIALGGSANEITVIYNPLVSETLLQRAAESVDHPWFSQREPPVVLAAGRLVPQKDFQTLLRAFAILRRTRMARLMILGEGPERAMLYKVAQKMGIADDVEMPGFVENPYKYMKRAKVFVCSSLFEGLPNVLVEAMACGTPVISTNCPSGPSEILEQGRWGRLVATGDVGGLAMAIEQVLDEVAHPNVRSRAAMFTIKNITDAYLDVALA